MKLQNLGGGRYMCNGWEVIQIDSVFVVVETEQELTLTGLDSLPYRNPWAAPVQDLRKPVKPVKPAPKAVKIERGFLSRQPLSLEAERLQAAYKKVASLVTKKGDKFCFSCGRVNPAAHPSGGTACCQDEVSTSKKETLENIKDSLSFLQ